MKMVFDANIERCDYLEFILSPNEANQLFLKEIVADYPKGLIGKRSLNVFMRVDRTLGDIMPLVKGKAAKSKEGFSENVKREMEAGKPQAQSVAIAYAQKRKAEKKKKKK